MGRVDNACCAAVSGRKSSSGAVYKPSSTNRVLMYSFSWSRSSRHPWSIISPWPPSIMILSASRRYRT